jgi:hypothetical protein
VKNHRINKASYCLFVLIIISLPSLLLSGGSHKDSGEFREDSWYTGWPEGFSTLNNNYEEIHRLRILPVPDKNLNEAVSLLEDVYLLQLELEETVNLLSLPQYIRDESSDKIASESSQARKKLKQITEDKSLDWKEREIAIEKERLHRSVARYIGGIKSGQYKPYLVRALLYEKSTGDYSAYWLKDNELFIHHQCLASRQLPMKRHPIVILLEKEPKQVHVSLTYDM